MKKYFNMNTRQVEEIDDEFYSYIPNKSCYLDNDVVENNIVLLSLNDFRIFPNDELGLNKDEILPLLEYFKPATEKVAKKIGRYYKVCPYCLKNIKDKKNTLILDCKGSFSNIRKMQVDVYYEAYCCRCHHEIPFSKTNSVSNKAKYIMEAVYSRALTLIRYTVDNYDILIDICKFTKLDFSELVIDRDFNKFLEENGDLDNSIKEATLRNLDDLSVLREVFERNLYLGIRKDGDVLIKPDTDEILKKMILKERLKI